jgi:protein-tyrosine phosphatase
MASILVVCTGNVCRSPAAEAFLRRALTERLGSESPWVSSAGTAGWEGSGATEESVRASAERGVDTRSHVARLLTREQIGDADLIIVMATEHARQVRGLVPDAAARTFTLKELVRLLEAGTPGAGLDAVGDAAARRAAGFAGNPYDEDVADPLGMSIDVYRAMAWELEEWTERLADALYGPAPAQAAEGG